MYHATFLSSSPEASLNALLEATDAGVVAVSTDSIVREWNAVAVRIFKWTREEMIGQSIFRLIAGRKESEARGVFESVLQGENLEPLETAWLDKLGRRIHVSISGAPLLDESGRQGAEPVYGVLFLIRDITNGYRAQSELDKLQASADHRTIVLDTANRVALDILSSRSGLEALRHIAEAARVLGGARYAALGVARPDGQGLSEFITVGLTDEEEARIGPRPRGAGVLGLLLKRSKPLRIDALSEHPASVGFPDNHPPMESFLGVPIRRGSMVIGSLYLTNKNGGKAFTASDEIAVETLGAHAAVAIYNLQMVLRQRSLVSGLITAQEEERRAIAYDLHDGLTQFVMASHAHFEAFRRAQAMNNDARALSEFELGKSYLQEAVVESRRLVNGLRPLALDDLGLPEALRQLMVEEKVSAGWKDIEWICNVEEQRFDKDLETTIYRVAQEALTNARKHAASKKIKVTLLTDGDKEGSNMPRLRLEVQDWGSGFDLEEKMSETKRVGLQSMAERANLLEGRLRIESTPETGTHVTAIFPARPAVETRLKGEIIERGTDE